MTRRIIGLWSTPRSVSTAFEKTFTRRDDTVVVHEPFTDCYYFGRDRRSQRYGGHPELVDSVGPRTIADILSRQAAVVFFKDLAFQAVHYVDAAFLRGVVNTFLIRHPQEVHASLRPLKPDFTDEEFGFEPLLRIFDMVTGDCRQPPIVVDGTRFRSAPEPILRKYCDAVGVAFEDRMLSWTDGRLREWKAHERESQAKWHQTLEHSTRILPPEPVNVAVPIERRELMERSMAIYECLLAHAL